CYSPHRPLPSFPTRRSSDLACLAVEQGERRAGLKPQDLHVPRRPGRQHECIAFTQVLFDEETCGHGGAFSAYCCVCGGAPTAPRSEEHTSELQSRGHLVCRL